MIISNYTMKILEPSSGHSLTQAYTDMELQERIFSKKVYLGVNDSEDNWKEISDEEVEAFQAEIERITKELADKENDISE